MRRAFLWVPPVLWMAFIFYLSSLSDPAPLLTRNIWDKALHGAGYTVLGLLLARAFRGEGYRGTTASVLAILCTSLYGATDEIHQLFTPMRESSAFDWIADTVGGLAGAALQAVLERVLPGWAIRQ